MAQYNGLHTTACNFVYRFLYIFIETIKVAITKNLFVFFINRIYYFKFYFITRASIYRYGIPISVQFFLISSAKNLRYAVINFSWSDSDKEEAKYGPVLTASFFKRIFMTSDSECMPRHVSQFAGEKQNTIGCDAILSGLRAARLLTAAVWMTS